MRPEFDELSEARSLGAAISESKKPTHCPRLMANLGARKLSQLIEPAEAPVIDKPLARLANLPNSGYANGQKSRPDCGEGAGRMACGYPVQSRPLMVSFSTRAGLNSRLGTAGLPFAEKVPHFPPEWRDRVEVLSAGQNAMIDS